MASTRDFLLEIGCEEMPSAPLMNAAAQLPKLIVSKLDAAGLAHGEARVFQTPRRLAAIVADVAVETEAIDEVKRGPKAAIAFGEDGKPTQAAAGFARKCGIEADQLVRRVDDDGQEYVFAEVHVDSQSAAPLLSSISHDVIASIEWPNYRSQRWGSEHESFVRPIRWICALLGDEKLDVAYADVRSSNTTRGHRVLGAGEHRVTDPSVYEQVLADACVFSAERRAELIREGIAKIEAGGKVRVDTPQRVFDEVVNLCEYPGIVVGSFDEDFLSVPNEIIVEAMLKHQRYFPIYTADGELTNEFVIVMNADPAAADTVRDGNERVVRARLDDAKFFYEEDLKKPLEAYLPQLAEVTFQEKLGTVLDKAGRMERLAGAVAGRAFLLGADDCALAERAAKLAKADLVTQAVIEFTSQQGVMGGYYAKAAGEPEAVACAIRDHYRPRFAGDEVPEGGIARSVAIADKLDTICGMFAIDQPPTGSSDPFAIRRSAIGVIAMLRDAPAQVLPELIDESLAAYADQGLSFDATVVAQAIRAFFGARLAAIAREEGCAPDTVEAVSAVGVVDPAGFLDRAHALEDARNSMPELFDDLATAYARAANLADAGLGSDTDEKLMGEAEKLLLEACVHGHEAVSGALAKRDFASALSSLAELRGPIDRFFEDVLVMDEDTDVRNNRLRLLNRFAGVFEGLADISAFARKR